MTLFSRALARLTPSPDWRYEVEYLDGTGSLVTVDLPPGVKPEVRTAFDVEGRAERVEIVEPDEGVTATIRGELFVSCVRVGVEA